MEEVYHILYFHCTLFKPVLLSEDATQLTILYHELDWFNSLKTEALKGNVAFDKMWHLIKGICLI